MIYYFFFGWYFPIAFGTISNAFPLIFVFLILFSRMLKYFFLYLFDNSIFRLIVLVPKYLYMTNTITYSSKMGDTYFVWYKYFY